MRNPRLLCIILFAGLLVGCTLAPPMDTPASTERPLPIGTPTAIVPPATVTAAPALVPFAALKGLTPGYYPVYWVHDSSDLYIGFLDGRPPAWLAHVPGWNGLPNTRFTQDNQKMVILENENEQGSVSRLWIYDLATGSQTRIQPVLGMPGEVVDDIRVPILSPDDQWILFSATASGNPAYQLFMTHLSDGKTICVIPWDGRNLPEGWSPDGKWIAFTSDAQIPEDQRLIWENGPADIYVVETSCLTEPETCSSQARRIAQWESGPGLEPDWSADGKIEYECGEYICQVNVDGSGLQKLPRSQPAENPAYSKISPDGKLIMYLGEEDQNKLYVRPVAGGEEVQITQELEHSLSTSYAWSPDGKYIGLAVGNEAIGDADIYIYVTDRRELIDLTNTPDEYEIFREWWSVPGPFQVGAPKTAIPDATRAALCQQAVADGAVSLPEGESLWFGFRGTNDLYGFWKFSAQDPEPQLAYEIPEDIESFHEIDTHYVFSPQKDQIAWIRQDESSGTAVVIYDLASGQVVQHEMPFSIWAAREWESRDRITLWGGGFTEGIEGIYQDAYAIFDPEDASVEQITETLALPGYQYLDDLWSQFMFFAAPDPQRQVVLYTPLGESKAGDAGIVLIDLASQEVLWSVPVVTAAFLPEPDWKSDGGEVVLSWPDETYERYGIYRLSRSGALETLYTGVLPGSGVRSVRYLKWSPSGRYVHYAVGQPGRYDGTGLILDIETGQLRAICEPQAAEFIEGQWVSDELLAYTVSRAGEVELKLLDLSSWQAQRLAAMTTDLAFPWYQVYR